MQNIEQTTFHALERGKHLVVLGAVHGNEQCGSKAIRQAINKFHSGVWQLQCGKVTFVPICNPKAYAKNKRFYERNLNRHFYPKPVHIDYEDKIDPILCKILDEADSLLDIHSYQSEGGAFCFLGTSSPAEIEYSRALNAPLYIYGWADAFAKSASKEQRLAGLGTTDYVRANCKNGMAVTLECGNHHDPHNVEVALQAIENALIHLGLMQGEVPPATKQIAIKMSAVYYRQKAGKMVQSWQHGQFVRSGEVIAIYDDGEQVKVASDGYIILPKVNLDADIGSEWFYFGVQTDFPT
jgi:predicted deacylase